MDGERVGRQEGAHPHDLKDQAWGKGSVSDWRKPEPNTRKAGRGSLVTSFVSKTGMDSLMLFDSFKS